MTSTEQIDDWVRRYVAAWTSNEPEAIGDLFTPDAEYRYHPWDEPVVGTAAIAASWLEGKDEPGEWSFESWTVAVQGDRGIVEGRTVYLAGQVYRNLWIIDLAEEGRAARFTEWYLAEPVDIPTVS